MEDYICWFSCGAASAVATKMKLNEGTKARIIRQDTGSEHPDNERFMRDCEEWFGQPIETIKSDKYADIWEVFEARKYLVGIHGAPCTSELKRIPAELQINFGPNQETEIFGYTVEESRRLERWQQNNNERKICAPLIKKGLTKADCLAIIDRAGIELPEMYKLGYRNNNCIGCVKGQTKYWQNIRIDFPDVFNRMAKLERKLNVAICKTEPTVDGERQRIRVFLDELPEAKKRQQAEPISCGLFCMEQSHD